LTSRRAFFPVALALLITLGLAAEFRSYAGADTGFLLDEAARVLDGARLYVDLVDMNPPLIVLLNMAAVLFARALGIPGILTYRLGFTALLLAALLLAAWLLRRLFPAEVALRRSIVLLVAFVLFNLPGQDFGEREHLLLALVLPYLLLAAARALRGDVPAPAALLIGALAAVGFALKPPFALLWLAIESYIRLTGRLTWRKLLPETWAIAGFLTLHAFAVLLWAPGYLRLVRLLAGPYTRFLYDPFWHVLVTGPGALLTLFALLAFAALRRQVRHRELAAVFALGALACLVAGASQQKGLSYHLYPAVALGAIVLGLLAWDAGDSPRDRVRSVYRLLAAGVFAALVVVACARNAAAAARLGPNPQQAEFERLAAVVRARAAGEGVYTMSYHIGSAYPLINYGGARSASRFAQLWILPAAYMDQLRGSRPLRYHAPGEMGPSERFLNQAVLEDLRDEHPKLLVVLKHARDLPANGFRRLDYVAYFSRDPRIARLLDRFQLVAEVGDFLVYEWVPDGVERTGPAPAVRPGTQDVIVTHRADEPLRLGDPTFLLAVLAFAIGATLAWFAERGRAGASAASRPTQVEG